MRRDEALSILRQHREELAALGVKEIYLFGSVARDEATPKSDIDVLVELSRPMGYFEFFDIQEALEQWFGCKVDLGTTDSLKPRLKDHVLAEVVHG